MISRLDEISDFNQLGYVTITSYEKDIERNVPHYSSVLDTFQNLSDKLSSMQLIWRYDSIFINEKYFLDYHIAKFEEFCEKLEGYSEACVISFIDLYEKTKKFPEVCEVTTDERLAIGEEFFRISKKHKIQLKIGVEGKLLQRSVLTAQDT